MFATPMGTDNEGSRTGALGSPPAAERIHAAQLPRPPEQPPVLAAACSQENGADNGCQAKDIAPDTLPRPPVKCVATKRLKICPQDCWRRRLQLLRQLLRRPWKSRTRGQR